MDGLRDVEGAGTEQDARVARFLVLASRGVSASVALLASAVLAGYLWGHPALAGARGPSMPMGILTAASLLSASAATFFQTTGRLAASWASALVAGAWSIVALASNAALGADHLSALIETSWLGVPQDRAGRTALATAACLALLAAACWPGWDRRPAVEGRARWPNVLAGLAASISGLALLARAYGAESIYASAPFIDMGARTAAALAALGLAAILGRPDHGWARTASSRLEGGGATRRQLAIAALPLAAGWGLLRAVRSGSIDPPAAVSLLVAISVVPLAWLVLRDGASLNQSERERRRAADAESRAAARLEERLREQAARLEAQAAERATLDAALGQVQRLDAVGQLTGGIAHDFNNLLMAIKGNLELMRRRVEPGHPARAPLDRAADATSKGAKLTAQLLAFSRTQRLALQPVSVDGAIAGALDLARQALGPGFEIKGPSRESGLWARSDGAQLELALLNLAINARDAMPRGGAIEVSVSACDPAGLSGAPGDWVWITLSDHGEGMAPEVLARAAEPFFTTKPQGKGTGLGLAQVHGFAKQCGGEARIRSALGAGTSVDIRLPRCEGGAPPTAAAAPIESQRGGGRARVLVIDDDDAVRRVVADGLREAGYEVDEAPGGAEGLRRMDEAPPALAVIDFMMPGMDGAEAARRARAKLPSLPIVFVSGYSDTLALDGIADAVVIRKPFELAELLAVAREALVAPPDIQRV